MKVGCVNVRGWSIGKFEDACKELNEWKLDVVGVTETHLRDEVRIDSSEYVKIGKGRKKQETLGGGIAFLHKKERNFKVDEIDVANSAMSEDVLAVRVEYIDQQVRSERMIMIVVYMTVEVERARRENSMKYKILKKIVKEHAGENDGDG